MGNLGDGRSPLILGEKTRLGIWKRSKTLEKVEKVERILEKGVKWRWNQFAKWVKRLNSWDSFDVSGSLVAGKWQTVAGERGGRESGALMARLRVRGKSGPGREKIGKKGRIILT